MHRQRDVDGIDPPDMNNDNLLQKAGVMPIDARWIMRIMLEKQSVMRAHLLLMMAAWQQDPVASLPNDYQAIQFFSGLSPNAFQAHFDRLMQYFILCTDNRWYHQVLLDGLSVEKRIYQPLITQKNERSERAKLAAQKRWGKNITKKGIPLSENHVTPSLAEVSSMVDPIIHETLPENIADTPPVLPVMDLVVEPVVNTPVTEGKKRGRKTKEQAKSDMEEMHKVSLSMDLQGVVSFESWENFVNYRLQKWKIEKKYPPTENSMRMSLKKLIKLRDEGYNPTEILEHTIEKGWVTFYVDERIHKKTPVRKFENHDIFDHDFESGTVTEL